MLKAASLSMKMDIPKSIAAFAPAVVAAPAFAAVDVSRKYFFHLDICCKSAFLCSH
jgi:hypothetical protein